MRIFLFPLCILITVFANCADLPMLHATRGMHAGIYDTAGRQILLRGVNYNALGEYWQGVPGVPPVKQYEDSDFILMEQYGFNCVRLLFTWSGIEPVRGKFDTAYVARIKHAVEVAGRHNLYVLLDMHQDAWGMYVAGNDTDHCLREPAKGWDGAPKWATLSDAETTCSKRSRESAPAVIRAFSNFWDDRDSLQEDFVRSWALVVKFTAGYSNVLGYDLINEPGLGERGIVREDRLMGRFYNKVMHGIRKAEKATYTMQHIILFEPTVTWRGRDYPSVPLTSFRRESNILFSPHHYFESLSGALSIEQGFGLMRFGASLYNTGLLIGEWGFFGGERDTLKLSRYAKQEDHYMISSTWWQWSQACGDPHSVGWNGKHWQAGNYSMHLIELNQQGRRTGKVNEAFLHILNRSRPLALPGRVKGFSSDPNTGELVLKGHTRRAGKVSMYIPARFGKPVVTGNNAVLAYTEPVAGGLKAEIDVKGKYSLHMMGK